MKYRLIHFVPDHARGARFPIAAAVTTERGVQLVEAKSEDIPGPLCLGGKGPSAILTLVRQSLRDLASFDHLPASAGPHAVWDAVRDLPDGVADAEAWIRRHVLAVSAEKRVSDRKSSLHRITWGARFFERWKVNQYVQTRFHPESDLQGWLKSSAATLGQVTHWVEGKSEVFLMEPVVPHHESFAKEVLEVGRLFNAYRFAMGEAKRDRPKRPRLIAYVLQGGTKDDRAGAINALRGPSHEVIDTSNQGGAMEFTSSIRKLALTAKSQSEFDSP